MYAWASDGAAGEGAASGRAAELEALENPIGLTGASGVGKDMILRESRRCNREVDGSKDWGEGEREGQAGVTGRAEPAS